MFIVSEVFPQHSGDLDLAEKVHICAIYFEGLLKLKRLSTEIELLGTDPVKIS